MPASFAPGCRSTSTTRPTIMPRSGRGACSLSLSRPCAPCGPTMSCGATSRTNTSTAAWPSISSAAASCCASGSTIAPRRPRTSRRSPAATSKPGSKSARRRCCTAEDLFFNSENALAEFLQRGFRKRKAQPGLLLQPEPAAGNRRRVLEQLGLQWIALRVGERLDDAAGGARGDEMGVDEAVVVRGDLDMVHLAQRGELAALGEAAHHGAVELQDLDRLLLEQRAAAVAGQLAFAGRQRDARLLRQQLQFPAVVGPAHRLFQPARPQRLEQAGAVDGGGEVPAAVHVDHQVLVVADDFTHQRQALQVLAERQAAGLGLEPLVCLRLQHLDLVAQRGRRLAVAVVRAGDVARHLAAVAAEQAVERQPGHLAEDVPGGNVHCGRDPDHGFARPAFLVRPALPRQGEELLVKLLPSERIGADDQLADAAAKSVDRRLDGRVAGGEADALDAFVSLHPHQDLARLRYGEMTYPVRPPGIGCAQDVSLELGNLHSAASMPASLISFAHFAWSSRMKRANSSGVLPPGSAPSAVIFARTSACASTLFTSALSFSTMLPGVAAGASRPNQPTAW